MGGRRERRRESESAANYVPRNKWRPRRCVLKYIIVTARINGVAPPTGARIRLRSHAALM